VLNNDWIESILLTRDEKLYVGTMDGVGCLDLKSLQFTSTFGSNRILPGTPIHALYEDAANTIWVGTSDGVVSIQPKEGSPTLTHYTTDDGLPSNEVHGVLEDSLNSLWFSTSYGIARFNLQNRTFINYYSGDGLQGNEFTGAATMGNDGDLIFGGINGLTLFNPKEIINDVKKLTVSVTGFYIHNQPVNKGVKSGNYDIIQSSVFDADTFHLSHTDNSFTIEFSAMAFSNPERITYLYSLDDDDEWITLRPGAGNVTFNNLSPGEYTFKVKAKDYNNYSEAKTIHIIIHPAWYFSFWAKCTYVFVLLILTFMVTQQIRQRQQTKREMREHIHAQEIIEAKLQFFINIAHEIRTPMTLIISPLKKLMSKDKDRERKRSYFLMNRNSERILHLINQLMDIQKIDKGQMTLRFQETEVVEYISELCHVFDEQTVGKHIELQYLHDMDELTALIDPNNFDKVILNVLSNALNFTPDHGTITVSLSVGLNEKSAGAPLQEYFQVTISDTGTGIPDSELEKVFECFYQTREKKRSSTGTGIGLYLTRSIVELHHGTIRAENNHDGPGCKFIIQLPLHADHIASDQLASDRSAPIVKKEHFTEALPSLEDLPGTKIKVRSKHRILVVDDDREIRKYICDEMAADFHMMECSNGKEALSSTLKNAPDLIISDIMMPEMDGITLCQKIKQNVNINQIPVILLTAKAEEEDNLEGLGIGADAYIVKPFNIELLRVTVQNIIKNRHILKNNFAGNQHQKDKVADVAIVSSDEKLLLRIMETINTNIDNPALNVEMLSREVGISRVHLHRKLKELTNQTTRDLIRNIRLQQAGKLLSEKQLNISEVAFAVGFTNIAHFSSAFKEFYGVPPTTYMENQLSTQLKKQRPLS
jgi:signal transduction histidine kinase/DNA-binding response OmpR family regulator